MAKNQIEKISELTNDLSNFKIEVSDKLSNIPTKSDLDDIKKDIVKTVQQWLSPYAQSTGASTSMGNQPPPSPGSNTHTGGPPPRQPFFHHKINIPSFDPDVNRECTRSWINKLESYFTLHTMSEEDQLLYASIHLYGRAHHWFNWWKREYPSHQTWLHFTSCFFEQYEDTWSQSFFTQLTRLKQTSTVEAYTDEFQALYNCTPQSQNLDKQTVIDIYVAGLQDRIQMRLKTMAIYSLKEAFKWARAVEAEFAADRPSSI